MHIRKEFHDADKNILKFETWPQYFELARLPLPPKPELLRVLEGAVGNSLKKDYHRKDTDFCKIHRSGVSKILLKGESYSADPNLRDLQLLEKWKYTGAVIYMDASCLIYDFTDTRVGTVH